MNEKEVVEYLLERGADTTPAGLCLLFFALFVAGST
jgi:hypothetical protein